MAEPSNERPQAETAEPVAKTAGGGARRQRTAEQTASSVSALLAVVIVGLVNFLAFRHYDRLDWTSQGMFTLSDKTKKVLRGLNQDVDLYLFLSQGEDSYSATEELMQRYKAETSRLHVNQVDPERSPVEFKTLQQRFGILQGQNEMGEVMVDVAAVVAIGDKNWHVSREDLIGYELGGEDGQTEQVSVKAEQALTGAIVQVTSGRPTKVCVSKGHGEWSLAEEGDRALGTLKFALRHDNIEWEQLDTAAKKEIPKGCDAVFVVGPESAFSEAEAQRIVDYLHAGGNALLALDPVLRYDEIQPTGFEQALAGIGVRLDRTKVEELDPERRLSPIAEEFMITSFGDHTTTNAVKYNAPRIVMGIVRSLSLTAPNERITPVLRTSDTAFGAVDLKRLATLEGEPTRAPGDMAGPLDVALAVDLHAGTDGANKRSGGRLLVIGDSDFLAAPLLNSPQLGNFDFASAVTGWLTQRAALVQIPPKKVKGGSVVFSQEQLQSLLFSVGVLLPGAALLLGIAVWLQRRA